MIAERRMPLALILSRAAQGYSLINSAVVSNDGGFPDDHTGTVIDEQPPADGGAGMDLDVGAAHTALGNPAGQEFQAVPIAPVRPPMGPHRLIAIV